MNNNYQNSGFPGQQPPNPNGYYYQPPVYNTGYPKKQPYAEAAENALDTIKTGPFLLVSIIFGLLCSRSLLCGETGIGMTIMGIVFYLLYIPFILRKQHKVPLSAWLLLIPQAVILVSFSLYSGIRYTLLALLALFVIAMFQTTLMAGCSAGKPFSFELLCDVCSTYLAYPFMNIGKTFSKVFSSKKNKSSQKKEMSLASKIGIGLIISIPVVLILVCLLSTADKVFSMLATKFIDSLNLSLGRIIRDILLTFITMLYIMPLVVTLRSGYHKPHEKKEHKRPFDAIIITTVLFSASAIYLIFAAVQFRYLFSESGKLPEGLTYAEYCRRGFFELVFVIVVTTIVIALTCIFTKLNDNNKLPVYTKIALILLIVSDYIMIASAARRLYIYVDKYNMTTARLNAAVLILFMGICLVAILLRIIFEKIRMSAIIGSAAAVIMALYCIADIDGFIAGYNVDKYLENPRVNEIDIYYLSDMSASAIPHLERLAENAPDSKIKERARSAMADIAYWNGLFDGDSKHIARWTLDRQRATNILKKHKVKTSDIY